MATTKGIIEYTCELDGLCEEYGSCKGHKLEITYFRTTGQRWIEPLDGFGEKEYLNKEKIIKIAEWIKDN